MSQLLPSPIEEVVSFFARGPSPGEIACFHLTDAAQDHIRGLLGKNSEGTLTREESRELDKIMALNDVVSLIRVRAQGVESDEHRARPSALTGTEA